MRKSGLITLTAALYGSGTVSANGLSATGIGTQLSIPTYDGSGEIVHLDVYHNAAGWNGYPYWMVMTPYPDSNDQYENPSIVCSLDGNTWVVPEGLTNPLVLAPEGGFNSDTDMIVVGNTMYVLYRKYITATDTLHYMLMSSTNGVTWTEPIEIYAGLTDDDYGRGIAPSIVFTDSKFKVFSQANSRLAMRWSSAIGSGWSEGENLGYLPIGAINHMNVTEHSDGRLFLIATLKTGGTLSVCESSDYGATWIGNGSLGISGYRAAMVETPSGFDVWYTNSNDVYRTSIR